MIVDKRNDSHQLGYEQKLLLESLSASSEPIF